MKRNCVLKVAMLVIALVVIGFGSAKAQEKGEMAAGVNLGISTGSSVTSFGVGGKFQYNVAKVGSGTIRGEGAFNYYLGDGGYWDLSVNGHYLISLPVPKLAVYPLAGLSIVGLGGSVGNDADWEIYPDDPNYNPNLPYGGGKAPDSGSVTKVGFNIGAGVGYDLTDRITANFELKYRITSATKVDLMGEWGGIEGKVSNNKFIIQVGVTYKF